MADAPTLIGSVQRALHLLDAVSASERPSTAKKLARTVSLPLPTTYHLLRTLVHEGYLRKLEDGYVLGDHVVALRQGNAVPSALPRIRPVLRALRDQLRGAAYLALYSDGEIRLVDVVDGPNAPCADLWVGVHESGHATAFGKCILSNLDQSSRADYFCRYRLADLTPRTITSLELLEQQFSCPREYFEDREEYLLGTACVAAPVRAPGFLGAVAISMPARRYRAEATEPEGLIRSAQRVSRALAIT